MYCSANCYSSEDPLIRLFLIIPFAVLIAMGQIEVKASFLNLKKVTSAIYGLKLCCTDFAEIPLIAGTPAYSGYSPGDEIHFSRPHEKTKKFFRLSGPPSSPSRNRPTAKDASSRETNR